MCDVWLRGIFWEPIDDVALLAPLRPHCGRALCLLNHLSIEEHPLCCRCSHSFLFRFFVLLFQSLVSTLVGLEPIYCTTAQAEE